MTDDIATKPEIGDDSGADGGTEAMVRDGSVTLSRAQYKAMVERIEDLEDELDLLKAVAERGCDSAAFDRHSLPDGSLGRLIDGESTVRVWREHRGLSGKALAAAAGIQPSYLSAIEHGHKPGSLQAMAAISKALDVPLDLLALRFGQED